MHSRFALLVAGLVCVAFLTFAPSAEAQTLEVETPQEQTEQAFMPGDIDLTLTGGLAGWWSIYVEPGIDFGLMRLSDDLALSVGGVLNVGYCVFCLVLSAILPLRVSAWYASPMLRSAVHLNMIGESLDMPHLDVYGGFMGGPGYYRFDFDLDDATASGNVTQLTLLLGPYGGARYAFSGRTGLFVFFEARILAEFGLATLSLDIGTTDEREVYETTDRVMRGGLDFALGVGLRF